MISQYAKNGFTDHFNFAINFPISSNAEKKTRQFQKLCRLVSSTLERTMEEQNFSRPANSNMKWTSRQ